MGDQLFYRFFILFYIHRNGVLTALARLVPHETAATIQPCTMLLQAKPQMYGACVFSCNPLLHSWQNDWDLLRATAVTRGGTDTEVRVITESRPWSRKFSRRSCRDSNPRPFDHESGALTTELSPFVVMFFFFFMYSVLSLPYYHRGIRRILNTIIIIIICK